MKELIADFTRHIKESQHNELKGDYPSPPTFENVIISGLGGSGISGSIVSEICARYASLPVVVIKDYQIPAFVGQRSLFIACSYSGNTEETLYALQTAIERKAYIACLTSGGELLKIAQENNYPHLSMPGGNPPRSMFGFAFTNLLLIMQHFGILDLPLQHNFEQAIATLDKEEENIIRDSAELAKKIYQTTPAVYAVSGNLGIAARWRQQLNENAKMLAWNGEIPEMNHNELVGWEGGNENYSALILRTKSDFERNQKRIAINKEILSEKTPHVYEIWSKGEGLVEETLYLVHWGDWLSYHLSELRKVDIIDIKSIELLKAELGKVPL